jgi:hypothetical protein
MVFQHAFNRIFFPKMRKIVRIVNKVVHEMMKMRATNMFFNNEQRICRQISVQQRFDEYFLLTQRATPVQLKLRILEKGSEKYLPTAWQLILRRKNTMAKKKKAKKKTTAKRKPAKKKKKR